MRSGREKRNKKIQNLKSRVFERKQEILKDLKIYAEKIKK